MMLAEAKYRLTFPIKEYLQAHYSDGKINSTGQFMATCPHCEARGDDGKDKFYYDIKNLKGLCQRCYVTEEHGGFQTLVGLIMFTEHITYPQAIERIKSTASVDNIAARIMMEISKFKQGMVSAEDLSAEDYWDVPIHISVPGKCNPNLDVVKVFFANRKRPMPMSIIELFPIWFSKYDHYQNRAIFEIRTNNSKAWLAYAVNPGMERKTLNPTGSVLSFMLGGYNYFKDDVKPLLVVEGLFDLFRCILRGYNAVCSFGNKLGPRQVALLNQSRASQIVLCYDSDVKGYGWKGMWKVMKKYRGHFSKPVTMMFMERMRINDRMIDTDPDIISEKKFKEAYENRRLVA